MSCFYYKLTWSFVAVFTVFVLGSCGESDQASSTSSSSGNKVAVTKKQPQTVNTKKNSEEKKVEYRYSRIDKRDPFKPLVKIKNRKRTGKREGGASEPVEELTPLQKVDINSLRLLGIIIGKGEPRAMVDAPDGKSYILKNGVKVGKNNGKVVEISADAVLVKEMYQDFSGEVRENILEIGLPDREGDR